MADLEDFLRQAAERRKQRQQGQPGSQSIPTQPVRSAERARQAPRPESEVFESELVEPDIVEPEIIEPEIIEPNVIKVRPAAASDARRNLADTTLPPMPKSSRLSREIDQADEKMASHVKSALDHDLVKVGKQKKSKSRLAKKSDSMANQETHVDRSHKVVLTNEILSMLRQPQSLKTAFIASEIFKRKFD